MTNTTMETMLYDANCEIERLTALSARLLSDLSYAQGRFLNINIILASGGTKREAIALADVGEDCCKMAIAREAPGSTIVRVVPA